MADAGTRLTGLLTLVDAPGLLDLEDLERRLTVIEEKLTAALIGGAPEDFMLDVRREMDRQLAPYRRKMTSAQLRNWNGNICRRGSGSGIIFLA